MSACASRHKQYTCSLDGGKTHDVHVALDENGIMLCRWRVVTEAIPNREVPDDD